MFFCVLRGLRGQEIIHVISTFICVYLWTYFMVLSHGNQLFRAGWVNRHRVIEVLLAGAHAYRNGKALQHFIRTRAEYMTANDFLSNANGDEFHRSMNTAFAESVLHRSEARLVDLDGIAMKFPCFCFGQPHCANRRM